MYIALPTLFEVTLHFSSNFKRAGVDLFRVNFIIIVPSRLLLLGAGAGCSAMYVSHEATASHTRWRERKKSCALGIWVYFTAGNIIYTVLIIMVCYIDLVTRSNRSVTDPILICTGK